MRGAPRSWQPDEYAGGESAEAASSVDASLGLLVRSVLDYGVFLLDTTGHIASWNAGAERIKGYRADEIIGQHFSIFYPTEDIAAGKPEHELETAITEGRLEDEGWRLRKDGTRFWANVVITALFDATGELRGFGKVTRDLTERRAIQMALSERRRLVSHLMNAQEIERRRIAWDVHDDSIQAMVAVGMRLQLLASRLPAPPATELHELDDAVRATIRRLRGLVFRLRPPGIDRHGLVEALSSYLAEVVPAWGLKSSLRHELHREPPPETATTIYRICQEALTNVHKHAEATTVEVSLVSVGNGTLVHVVDDGVGCTTPLEPQADNDGFGIPDHFGVIEMRERAETAGGWWTITGRPKVGTTVEFWLPDPPAVEPGR